MISGQRETTATLTSAKGRQVLLEVITPNATPDNLRQFRAAADEWDRLGDTLDAAGQGRQAIRAWFASDTVFEVGEWASARRCCFLVAVDATRGDILGATIYSPDSGHWWIHQFTVSPDNQPGSANQDQVRGIGSTMLGVIADQVANDPGCVELNLFALDEDAARFWQARGFRSAGPGIPYKLTCPETKQLAAKVRAAGVDRPDQGDEAEAYDPALSSTRPKAKSKILQARTGSR